MNGLLFELSISGGPDILQLSNALFHAYDEKHRCMATFTIHPIGRRILQKEIPMCINSVCNLRAPGECYAIEPNLSAQDTDQKLLHMLIGFGLISRKDLLKYSSLKINNDVFHFNTATEQGSIQIALFEHE